MKIFQDPNWGFGTSEKMPAIKPKFDFYDNVGFMDDPLTADTIRKPKTIAHKIGTEPRVNNKSLILVIDANEYTRVKPRPLIFAQR